MSEPRTPLDVDDWWPLIQIAERMGEWAGVQVVPYQQLHAWSSKSKNNGFPAPKRQYGRYKFYDIKEVQEWLIMYQKISARFKGQGARLHPKGGGDSG
jgi:hypothetical protein